MRGYSDIVLRSKAPSFVHSALSSGFWVGVVLILLSPLIKKLMHLDTLGDVDHSLAGQSELAEPQAAGLDTSGEGIDI